jgi:hypothetical protein
MLARVACRQAAAQQGMTPAGAPGDRGFSCRESGHECSRAAMRMRHPALAYKCGTHTRQPTHRPPCTTHLLAGSTRLCLDGLVLMAKHVAGHNQREARHAGVGGGAQLAAGQAGRALVPRCQPLGDGLQEVRGEGMQEAGRRGGAGLLQLGAALASGLPHGKLVWLPAVTSASPCVQQQGWRLSLEPAKA